MKNLLLPVDKAQAIVDYLVKQPWGEVNVLINIIQSLRHEEVAEERAATERGAGEQ